MKKKKNGRENRFSHQIPGKRNRFERLLIRMNQKKIPALEKFLKGSRFFFYFLLKVYLSIKHQNNYNGFWYIPITFQTKKKNNGDEINYLFCFNNTPKFGSLTKSGYALIYSLIAMLLRDRRLFS